MVGNSRVILQPRDLRVTQQVGIMRVADCDLIQQACGFHSKTRVNARLLQLTNAGILRRFFLGSGGGRKAIYALSAKGAKLAGVPLRGPRRRQDEMLVADFFIEHQLAVNRVYCALKFRPIPTEGVAFHRWIAFHEPVVENVQLIPDGYMELETASGIVGSFVEVDLGHENLSIWKEKTNQYLALATSGAFAQRFGQQRFRVLVLAHSERRVQTIRKTVAAITPKIFWFASLEQVHTSFFSPVWLRSVGDQPQTFFENHP